MSLNCIKFQILPMQMRMLISHPIIPLSVYEDLVIQFLWKHSINIWHYSLKDDLLKLYSLLILVLYSPILKFTVLLHKECMNILSS